MNGNLETEEYAEGIYVGYRYFDSFGIEPLFSFGYGLSYTEFDIRLCGINTASKGVTVTVEVENTGTTYSGKEVVQIYASLPQDGSRKEFRRLVGYEKTEELKPGEKEMLNIVLPAKAFASFFGRAAGVENPGRCLWNMDWKQLVRGKTFSGGKGIC